MNQREKLTFVFSFFMCIFHLECLIKAVSMKGKKKKVLFDLIYKIHSSGLSVLLNKTYFS